MARMDAIINKETLGFICSRIGITAAFLSQRTGVAEEKIEIWLDTTNDDFPTINQAKSLAHILKVPFAGFYMDKANLPIKQLPSFRNLRTLPLTCPPDDSSLNLAICELIRYHDFLKSSEEEMKVETRPLTIPTISNEASIVDYVQTIRTYFELELETQFKMRSSRQFYLYVRQKIESKGIFIYCFTNVDVEIARGVSIYNETAPIIGINNNDRYPAKTFSIIHELVHILKQQSSLCNDMFSSFTSRSEEVFCNAIAGEVLVPAESLSAFLSTRRILNISLDDIGFISERFSVSKEVITRRLFDINQLSKDEYDTITKEIHQIFIHDREMEKTARQEGKGQQIVKNVSREAVDKTSSSICKILLIGYSDGFFSKQDVSGFLGIKEKHIPRFIEEVARW